ncbi:MAG: cytochrome c3 family protein [Gammaproteobacteria bacterium]|nr:cytochrome c3 family protein [Gammaproteobacteria bacterium]
MKIINVTAALKAASVVVSGSLLLFSSVQAGTIVGTAHDFSGSGWTGGEICVACHTPHNSDTSTSQAPLWNHATTVQNFTMYDSTVSGSMDATADGTNPSGISVLCLSCHDGVTALDSFGGTTGTSTMAVIEGAGNKAIGGDTSSLTNDHPISILYDTALSGTDPGLHDPSATNVTIGGGTKTRSGTIASIMLSDGRVQCSSCHDVHNGFVDDADTMTTPFLKVTRDGSALCLTCHNK